MMSSENILGRTIFLEPKIYFAQRLKLTNPQVCGLIFRTLFFVFVMNSVGMHILVLRKQCKTADYAICQFVRARAPQSMHDVNFRTLRNKRKYIFLCTYIFMYSEYFNYIRYISRMQSLKIKFEHRIFLYTLYQAQADPKIRKMCIYALTKIEQNCVLASVLYLHLFKVS